MAKSANSKNAGFSFLRKREVKSDAGIIPSNGAEQVGSAEGEDSGTIGTNAGLDDAGTIDPVAIAGAPVKRRPGRPRKNPGEPRKERPAAKEKEADKLVVEPGPPDPTLIGFATEGIAFFNLMLAARLDAPEFAQIPRETDEMLAQAWLKFVGYYVTLAKVAGPMGAFSAALVATIYAYAPPAFSSIMRKRMAIIPETVVPESPMTVQ